MYDIPYTVYGISNFSIIAQTYTSKCYALLIQLHVLYIDCTCDECNEVCCSYLTPYICMMMYTYNCADGVPDDGIPIEEVVTVSLALTVVYLFLAAAGITFAAVCLTFNVVFRKKRQVALYVLCLGY